MLWLLLLATPPETIGVTIVVERAAWEMRRPIYDEVRRVLEEKTALLVMPPKPRERVVDVLSNACVSDPICLRRALVTYDLPADLELFLFADRDGKGRLLIEDRRPSAFRVDSGWATFRAEVGPKWSPDIEEALLRALPPEIEGAFGRLAVAVEPEDATVLVDGRVCHLPCELPRVRSGSVAVEVRAKDHRAERLSLELPRADTRVIAVDLEEPPVYLRPTFWLITGASVSALTVLTLLLIP